MKIVITFSDDLKRFSWVCGDYSGTSGSMNSPSPTVRGLEIAAIIVELLEKR